LETREPTLVKGGDKKEMKTQEYEEEEDEICQLDTTLNNMVIHSIKNNTQKWNEEDLHKIAVTYVEAWLEHAKELDAIKRVIAKDRGLSNRQTNGLLRSKYPLEKIDWME
jgi:hypothetical protein